MRLLLFVIVVTVCLSVDLSWASAQSRNELYETYKKTTVAQADDDPLIGIWSGSMCTKKILLAVIRNDDKNGFDLKAVLLNGKEVGYGFKNSDTWFYVSHLAASGVYEGKTVYRNRLFKNWYPNRVALTTENVFTSIDDARNSCGSAANIYVRKEPRPHSASESALKTGSGFLLHQTDFIITAYHVIEGSSKLSVTFPSGSSYTARVVARDVKNDLAILKLVEFKTSEDGFRMSLSAPLNAGDLIHALGFPLSSDLGERPSIVSGQVSSTTGLDDSPAQFRMTALVNPGNSGGPILNENGEVVGVVVATLVGRDIEGVKFGVKITTALSLLQQVQLKFVDTPQHNSMTASQLFAEFSKDVVLIRASK
jgi:S1-C subfamily serine protease